MPTIIPVKFTYAARDLWFDPAGTGAQEADHVICSTERGTEIGLATADAREVSEEELASRRAAWQPPAPKYTTGVLSRYARLVTSADKGAYLS